MDQAGVDVLPLKGMSNITHTKKTQYIWCQHRGQSMSSDQEQGLTCSQSSQSIYTTAVK